MFDYEYMASLLETFGPDLSTPSNISDLFDDIFESFGEDPDYDNYILRDDIQELYMLLHIHLEETVLKAFISGYILASKINAELKQFSEE